ncbi:MAG: universal stress protein [Acidimicrobiales bacterium]
MSSSLVPKRIMIPVDLSERAEAGVGYAAMLAGEIGADLLVMTNVHAAEKEVLEEFAGVEHISVTEAGQVALQRLVSKAAPSVRSELDLRFRENAAAGILEAAQDGDADMIVMTSHGRGGMSKWLLGSVAEKVVRESPVPVVVVPARD